MKKAWIWIIAVVLVLLLCAAAITALAGRRGEAGRPEARQTEQTKPADADSSVEGSDRNEPSSAAAPSAAEQEVQNSESALPEKNEAGSPTGQSTVSAGGGGTTTELPELEIPDFTPAPQPTDTSAATPPPSVSPSPSPQPTEESPAPAGGEQPTISNGAIELPEAP